MEQALQPLSLTSFIFGFGILRYPSDHARIRLSILYVLIMWSVYAYVFYYIIIFFSPKIIFNNVLNIFIITINLLVVIIFIIITFRKYKKFRACIRKLDFVDNTLEFLGTPKEYHKIRSLVKWIFATWLIMVGILWFFDSLWFIERVNDTRAIVIPIIKDYPLHINTYVDIIYMFLLRYIGTKLDKINNHLEELSEIEQYGLRCTWKKSLIVTRRYIHNMGNRKLVLWTIMHLHLELCQIARDMNSLFEIHMTLQMLSYFIFLIAMFYFQYHIMLCLTQMYGGDSKRLKLILWSDIWLVICLTKLISFNHICENVTAKARKTRDVIHKLTNLICFTETRGEIFQFILQISLRPLKFSGLGLFYFGYDFIRKFFLWILTAVVFMLQMNDSLIARIIFNNNNITCYD